MVSVVGQGIASTIIGSTGVVIVGGVGGTDDPPQLHGGQSRPSRPSRPGTPCDPEGPGGPGGPGGPATPMQNGNCFINMKKKRLSRV